MPAPKDSEPGPAPTLPPSLPADIDMALWDEADMRLMRGPQATFSDRPDDKPGEVHAPTIGHIGRYALKYQLGEGGIGTVYAAHDPLLTRLIAVKTLHVEVIEAERESFNALFLNEARAAAGLSHPNIVTVFDAGISDDRAYIAMELLKGRDLRQLRQEGWRATPAQAALIVRRVADALGYAHSKGVVHRDVKPANIFMVGRTQPRMLDFGIARVAHRHEGAGEIAAGSPYYMAPEQARHQTVDRRADVFSLGVVLYELLTDQKPFRGTTLAEISQSVIEHEPPLADEVDRRVPHALAQIAARAMVKDPEQRYRSARTFSRELRHWLDDNEAGADPEAPVRAKRPAWLAWAGSAAAAVVLGGAALYMANSSREPAPPLSARPVDPPAGAAPAQGGTGAGATVANAAPQAAEAVAQEPATTLRPPAPPAAVIPPGTRTPPLAKAGPGKENNAKAKAPAAKPVADKTRQREARDTNANPTEATKSDAAVKAPGIVRLAVSPWGQVEVDGQPAGTAPPLTELTLDEGKHQITIRNADFPPFHTTVTVTPGQAVAIKHKFGS